LTFISACGIVRKKQASEETLGISTSNRKKTKLFPAQFRCIYVDDTDKNAHLGKWHGEQTTSEHTQAGCACLE
jgi:hypothetical protein